MFSRLAARLPKASALNGVAARQVRNLSQPAVTGSKGRNMPAREPRTTAAATGAEATFTIRVSTYNFPKNAFFFSKLTSLHRMAPFSTVPLSVPTPTSLVKPSSPPPLLVTPSR